MKGKLIAFEGVEGCGKSTQLQLLAAYLRSKGLEVVETLEPGGTPIGQQVRSLLLSPDYEIDPVTETFLFSASRREHCLQVIKPALEAGKVVITDRFYLSTMAYQAYGGNVDLADIRAMTKLATEGIEPDLWLIVDIEPEEGFRRKKGDKADRIEQKDLDFHRRVRAGFRELAEKRKSAVIIDGMADKSVVEVRIRKAVSVRLGIAEDRPTLNF